MARSKGVTIKLTEKQRKQVQALTGADHREVRLERPPSIGSVKPASSLTAGRFMTASTRDPATPTLLTFRIER